jgi:rubredoxin---NAD+ reductase
MLIIIGTGLAGYNTAKAFRKCDQETPITLITMDDGAFYSKPQLSTGFTHKKTADELVVFTADQMREQLKATILVHTKVIAIDANNKTVTTDKNTPLKYTKLVIGAGADVLHAPLAGNAVSDVISINNHAHYAAFRERAKKVKHIVIMGAGLVGCEYSNDLINGGFDVTMIAPDKWPLERLLPEALGQAMQHEFEARGIRFYPQKFATEINHAKAGGYDLTLCNQHESLHADLVLSAIGFRASETLARMAGAACDKGVLVDRQFKTSVDDVFAIGDCSVVDGAWRPFVAPILHGSKALARVLCGDAVNVTYPVMPVVTKTPFCKMVTVPKTTDDGLWRVEGSAPDLRALFFTEENVLSAFTLLCKKTSERTELIQKLA